MNIQSSWPRTTADLTLTPRHPTPTTISMWLPRRSRRLWHVSPDFSILRFLPRRVPHGNSMPWTRSTRRITRQTCGVFSSSASTSASQDILGENLAAVTVRVCPTRQSASRRRGVWKTPRMDISPRLPSRRVCRRQPRQFRRRTARRRLMVVLSVAKRGGGSSSGGRRNIAPVECASASSAMVSAILSLVYRSLTPYRIFGRSGQPRFQALFAHPQPRWWPAPHGHNLPDRS